MNIAIATLNLAVEQHSLAERLFNCADIHASLALVARADGGRRFHEARADRLWDLGANKANYAEDNFNRALMLEAAS